MTHHRARLFAVLPLLAIAGLYLAGPLSGAARDLRTDLHQDLQLERRIDHARDSARELVHKGASQVAEQTGPAEVVAVPASSRPERARQGARRITAGSTPAVRTGPSALPTREVGGKQVPDFLAIRDDARDADGRQHSGRVPPR